MSGTIVLSERHSRLLRLAFTMILVAYFIVWLPQPVVGLSFIGLEMGEWVKFLPAYQSGELGLNRNLFYLPPLLLGLMVLAWTAGWPVTIRTRIAQIGAVLIATLALPSFDAVRFEPADQWAARLGAVALIGMLALGLARWPPYARPSRQIEAGAAWTWLILGLLGAVLPTWAYLTVRPAVANLMAAPVGIGFGVWLNGIGFSLTALVGMLCLQRSRGHGRLTGEHSA